SESQTGFTLVELLMVMLVISILAGIGFSGMNVLRTRTLITKADTYWRVLDAAIEMYVAEANTLTPANFSVADLGPSYLDTTEPPWFDSDGPENNANGPINLYNTAVANDCPAQADLSDYFAPTGTQPRPTSERVYYCVKDSANIYVW